MAFKPAPYCLSVERNTTALPTHLETFSSLSHLCVATTHQVSWNTSSSGSRLVLPLRRIYLSRHSSVAATLGLLFGHRRNSKWPRWLAVTSTRMVNVEPTLYFRTMIPEAYLPPASWARGWKAGKLFSVERRLKNHVQFWRQRAEIKSEDHIHNQHSFPEIL